MTAKDILDLIQSGGALGVLVLVVWGGKKRWWVYGQFYDEMRQDRDEWKELALNGTDLAGKAVDTAVTAAGRHR